MKNTKEITTGAMLLAIYGAVLLIDRQLSFLLTEVLVLVGPVLIIVFGNMYNFKDGIIFSIALLLISMIVSPSVYSYFYLILGSIIGNIYNFLLQKRINTKILLLIISGLFILADICYMFIISPMLLNETFDQFIVQAGEMTKYLLGSNLNLFLSLIGMTFDQFCQTISFTTIMVVGIAEGLIVHLLSLLLLKRFKINANINGAQILDLKPVPAYILFALSALQFALPYINNDMAVSICYSVSNISTFVLIYYGYIYCLIFLRVRYKKNYTFLLIIGILFLLPLSIFMLFFIGFLYGTGPLRKFLVVERKENE